MDATRSASNKQADSLRAQYSANDAATQVQQRQIDEQASQQMSERARQSMIERGRMIAIAADSGLGGNAQQRLGNDINTAEATDMATFETNRTNSIAQAQRGKQAGYRQTVDQLNALPQPSLLGAGLQIAGATLGAYAGQQRGTLAGQQFAPTNKAYG